MKPQLVKSDTSEEGLSLRLDKPAKRKSYLVPILIAAAVHAAAIGAVVVSLNGKQKAGPKPAETVAAGAKTAVPALRTEPQPVEAAPPASVAAPVLAAPATEPIAPKPVVKPAVKKAPARPVKAASAKKTTKATAASKTAKAKTVKVRTKPVAKPKPRPKPKAPVLDLDKLSKGH